MTYFLHSAETKNIQQEDLEAEQQLVGRVFQNQS
jgi:hypothetical protein